MFVCELGRSVISCHGVPNDCNQNRGITTCHAPTMLLLSNVPALVALGRDKSQKSVILGSHLVGVYLATSRLNAPVLKHYTGMYV